MIVAIFDDRVGSIVVAVIIALRRGMVVALRGGMLVRPLVVVIFGMVLRANRHWDHGDQRKCCHAEHS